MPRLPPASGGLLLFSYVPKRQTRPNRRQQKIPFLVLEAARAQGYEVVVAAIKEESLPGD